MNPVAKPSSKQVDHPPASHPPVDVQETTCLIIGGGPGGSVLALLLARQGIHVMLLEAHEDFDRDFRGDTIHPSVMEIMDQLGLADRLLELRHSEIHQATIMTPDGPIRLADFSRLKTRFPYIMMLPQVNFLEFVTGEAKRYPNFQLLMGASAQELIEENGVIKGVRYHNQAGWHEVRALLTVGADGRSSRVRRMAELEPVKTSPPMDVLWFRLPRAPSDPEGAFARFGRGQMMVMLDRREQWQVGYVILKGTYQHLREAGMEALRRSIMEMAEGFADRAQQLQDWKQVAVLSVESSRLKRWYLPGLLLIGDAAHVMSPIGGVGINYAIQDAVEAANVLSAPLKAGLVQPGDLGAVQRRREWPTRIIQFIQTQVQRRIIATALDPNQRFKLPLVVRIILRTPLLRDLPARIIAFGVRRVRVSHQVIR
jgi:2-polyprenyl-6-methoxyphenol hydroxylase-like FAD-dependent oxidoreductase